MNSGFSIPERIELFAVPGLGEIAPGDALGAMVCAAMAQAGLSFSNSDVLVVAQKIVSKAEGRLVELASVIPSPFAVSLSESLDATPAKDPRAIEVVLRESRRIVRMDAGLIISETHQGYVCANAGVDSSNVPAGFLSLLPVDPDASAKRLREEIRMHSGRDVAVIISDTFGRPWREGLTNVALGVAGLAPLQDYRGQKDEQGHTLSATVIATADELAAAAELLMGKTARRPAVVIRNFPTQAAPGGAAGKGSDIVRPREKDLFR
ncbi:MAG: coenzyme F420-0:L-glutamate ligase [Acidobacteria bacterium]|nr:coenzyme F420-0:L-glutamate ligase [Acidobacteriota bacterium]